MWPIDDAGQGWTAHRFLSDSVILWIKIFLMIFIQLFEYGIDEVIIVTLLAIHLVI